MDCLPLLKIFPANMFSANTKCKSCGESVQNINFYTHNELNHPSNVCRFCEEAFNSPDLQKRHMIQVHEECKQCNQFFGTRQSLDHHQLEHKRSPLFVYFDYILLILIKK